MRTADLRAGKIIGTAALFSILAREPLGLLGPHRSTASSTIRRSVSSAGSVSWCRSTRTGRGWELVGL